MRVVERSFDPETIQILKDALEHAAANLPPAERTTENKVRLASVLLDIASRGERDPDVLRRRAVMSLATA